ncbi:LysE family translocator [Microbispora sp. NBC_01389]|uniref:LysE family translocator n=1 Tax=Microbispora sp. NBC_01389 TaxID=2903584 RepID=UPI00324F3E78
MIRLAGAAYLLWLAWQAVRPGGVSVFAVRDVPPDSPGRLFTMGLMTNLLNPKIAVLYITVIPQFVDVSRGDVLLQGVVLGGLQIAVAATVNSSIVLAAGGVAGFLAHRPGWLRAQRIVTGGMLGALAVTIAVPGGASHLLAG